jgi:hypothetical protein
MLRFAATGEDIVLGERMKSLAFGYYAWEDKDERRHIKEAGSGCLVAHGFGISAKHVSKSFWKLDPQFDALERRKSPLDPQYQTIRVMTEFASLIYQIPHGEELVTWKPKVTWGSHDTDIDTIQLEPESPAARRVAPTLRYLPWQLLPPPRRALVRLYGWPEQIIDVERSEHALHVELHALRARVVEHFYPMRDHGFASFPAYRLDREFPPGFSGAAVVYNGRFAGVFSGPDLVACLWPLEIMTYQDENRVERQLSDLFESGIIDASYDRAEIKGRVKRVACEEALAGTAVESRCAKMHISLTDVT